MVRSAAEELSVLYDSPQFISIFTLIDCLSQALASRPRRLAIMVRMIIDLKDTIINTAPRLPDKMIVCNNPDFTSEDGTVERVSFLLVAALSSP